MVLVSSTASTAHHGVCCVSSCLWHPAQNSWPSRWLLSRWLLSRCAGSQTAWWQPTLDVRRRGPGLTLTPVLTPDSEARLRWPVIASPYKEPEPAPHPECMSHMSRIVIHCHILSWPGCQLMQQRLFQIYQQPDPMILWYKNILRIKTYEYSQKLFCAIKTCVEERKFGWLKTLRFWWYISSKIISNVWKSFNFSIWSAVYA